MSKTLQKPTFFLNPDKSHCVQACLKSVFSVTNPDDKFSWEQLEALTDYLPKHGAWVYPELLALNKYGLDTKLITGFDIKRFITEGFNYIEDEYGKEVADYERTHPHDYAKIKQQMQQALDKDLVIERLATINDIKKFIDNDWYVMVLVNSRALNNKPGYVGHRVLVYGFDDNGVVMHDPGPTLPGEGKHISWSQLEKAWPNAKELIAVKKQNS
ncbi:MAG TPA: hypothetical protein VIH90_04210 [Candidatus Saccharimonadales bacterium]